MPIHEYECDDCGLRVEELFKSTPPATLTCDDCGSVMRRLVSAANHSFAHTPTGPTPQNTGVTGIDHNFDRVIGRDAERRWKAIEERQAHKRSVLRDAHKGGVAAGMEHLVRTREGAGEYRVIGEDERKEVNARRKLAEAVSKAATQTPAGE